MAIEFEPQPAPSQRHDRFDVVAGGLGRYTIEVSLPPGHDRDGARLPVVLAGSHKTDEAIDIFKLNTDAYPKSSNAFDSVAEAYQANGDKELAIKNYQTAVELDPTSLNAVEMLKKLR